MKRLRESDGPASVTGVAVLLFVAVMALVWVRVTRADEGDFVWAASLGGNNYDSGFDLAVDSDGNVYTTGFFKGTADFDPGSGVSELTSAGSDPDNHLDIFISKLDSNGNFVWARSLGGPSDDVGLAVAVDKDGNVYATGRFKGTADFDPGTGVSELTSAVSTTFDIYVNKLDSSGAFVWAKSFGSSGEDQGFDITVDDSGNIYFTGLFEGTVDFDPGSSVFDLSEAGGGDIFVCKLNSDGNFIFAKAMGGSGEDKGLRIAVDNADNIYTTGIFSAMADFDPGSETTNLTSTGNADIFVSKLDSSGNFQWAWGKGSSRFDEGLGIDVDGSGNVYVTALHQDLVSNPSDADIYLAKLNSSGVLVWSRSMGSLWFDKGYDLTLDSAGDVYITGTFSDTVDFDGLAELTSVGDGDIFVSRWDSSGSLVWVQAMGGVKFEEGIGIGLDGAGNVYTAGRYQGTVDFDPGTGVFELTSAGADEIFVSKLAGPSPTAITLETFTAVAGFDGVAIDWETGTEIDNAGFHLYRAVTPEGPYSRITTTLIPARGDPVSGYSYNYVDAGATENLTYYYKLEDIDTSGLSTFYGPVSTAPDLSTGPANGQGIYLPLIIKEP